MIARLISFHEAAVAWLGRDTDGWFLGLAARIVFAAVLLVYFLNSAATKTGDGVFGFLSPTAGAYIQILPSVMESYGYNASAIPFIPYGLIVHAGTYAEFLLPVLLVLGLFTRLASLGMIGFVAVMTLVDITAHQVDAKTIGSLFDRLPDAAIADQRLLWVFVLVVLIVQGPGRISCDWLIGRYWRSRTA